MSELIIVPAAATRELLTWDLAIASARTAFESIAAGEANLFPVQVMHGINEADIYALKAGVDRKQSLVGFKFGGYWPDNVKQQLPTHSSTTVMLDAQTGYPAALISGQKMNLFRTAAADAVAVDCLARPESTVLGVIGAGHQAEYEIRAVAEVRALSLIKIFTRSEQRGNWIKAQLQDLNADIRLVGNAEAAVRDSDIVVTVTPSTEALVMDEWVSEGTHISAMGADIVGKQEISLDTVARAKLFADYPEQSRRIGELQHASKAGLIESPDSPCPIGLVSAGKAAGRTADSDITLFDSSGIAIQDLCIAKAILQRAKGTDLALTIDF